MELDRNVLPGTRKFTDEELQQFKTEIWPKLPTFRAEDWSIAACDMFKLFEMMKFPRTESQVKEYIVWADLLWGGRMTFEQNRAVMLQQHERLGYCKWVAECLDKDGDGYISKKEYDQGMDLIAAHEPSLRKISYEQMMKEADVNNDGLISIQEMIDWLGGIDQRVGADDKLIN